MSEANSGTEVVPDNTAPVPPVCTTTRLGPVEPVEPVEPEQVQDNEGERGRQFPEARDEILTEDVRRRIRNVEDNIVAPSSRRAYNGYQANYLRYLYLHCPSQIDHEFFRRIDERYSTVKQSELLDPKSVQGRKLKKFVVELLSTPHLKPLDFVRWDVQVFKAYILSLKLDNGKSIGKSALKSHRTALYNLFRAHDWRYTEDQKAQLKKFFTGSVRLRAMAQTAGKEKLEKGKQPLSYSVYVLVSRELLKSRLAGDVFTRSYLVMTWNLMCRSRNTSTIRYSHIEWRDDALVIFFSQTKTDQTGSKPKDPRHCYANPFNPAVCPVFALGVLWSVEGFSRGGIDGKLFQGRNPHNRFSMSFRKAGQSEEATKALAKRGIIVKEIGTHSIRKGVATTVLGGSTVAPPQAAVCRRAGWAMGGVQDTYIRYEAAADQYVGRVSAGLPIRSSNFNALPPRFKESDEVVAEAVRTQFENCPDEMYQVAEYALASLVYHSKWLQEHCEPGHRLLHTYVFVTKGKLDELRDKLESIYPEDVGLQPTGIPPHVDCLQYISSLKSSVVKFNNQLMKGFDEQLKKIAEVLEKSAAGTGTPTLEQMRSLMAEHQERIMELIRIQSCERQQEPIEDAPNPLFLRSVTIPANFDFPATKILDMWDMWICGHAQARLPPFRSLKPYDFPTAQQKRKFRDLRYVMAKLENEARKQGIGLGYMSPSKAAEIFDKIQRVIVLPTKTPKGRQRRVGLSWQTCRKLLREEDRKAKKRRLQYQNSRALTVIETHREDESGSTGDTDVG